MPGFAELVQRYEASHELDAATAAALAELRRGEDPFRRDQPLHLTASSLVVHRGSRRVLLRYHQRVGGWIHLGGHFDPGEHDPYLVAERESAEESGLADLALVRGASPDDLVQIALVAVAANSVEPAHHHLDLRYVFVTETPEEARAESESAPVIWLDIDEAIASSYEANLRPLLEAAAELT